MKNQRLIELGLPNTWDRTRAKESLIQMYTEVIKMCDIRIAWYDKYRRRNSQAAQIIRVIAIIFLVASTLIPYFSAMNSDKESFLYWGYVLAGLGAGMLLFDRYFGLSSSWIRFTMAGYDLENARNIFINNWQVLYTINHPLTLEVYNTLANSIIDFQQITHDIVKGETSKWATEFQQNFNDLISALKNQSDNLNRQIEKERQQSQGFNRVNKNAILDIPERVILEAIDEKYDIWKSKFNIIGAGPGKKKIQGQPIDLNSLVLTVPKKLNQEQDVFNEIPAQIRYESGDGEVYNIPTDVLESGGTIKAKGKPALLCDGKPVKRPGCSISRRSDSDSTGTLGLKVYKEGQEYIISCYHVLCTPELSAGIKEFSFANSIGDIGVVSPGSLDSESGIPIADVVDGELSNELDCALALIKDPALVTDVICQKQHGPASILRLNETHQQTRYQVTSVGRSSGLIDGRVELNSTRCDIEYEVGGKIEVVTMKGMICTDQISNEGDSGSPVFDNNLDVIGIIIAASGQLSYILPIQRILKRFSVSIKPDIL